MGVVQDRNALLLLSAGQHKLYVISLSETVQTGEEVKPLEISTTFENITDDCMVSQMFTQPIDQKFLGDNYGEYKFFEECILYFALDNGNIFSCLLHFDNVDTINKKARITGREWDEFAAVSLMPQNLYVLNK